MCFKLTPGTVPIRIERIRFGTPWMPIPIQIRILQNYADLIRVRIHNATLRCQPIVITGVYFLGL